MKTASSGNLTVIAEYICKLDSPGDKFTKLVGDASWTDAATAVRLGGNGHVEVPAVQFQKEDFSFGMWINPEGFRSDIMHLYSDWSSPWSFRFRLQPGEVSGCFQLGVWLRRDINSAGSDPLQDMVVLTGGVIKPNTWSFVALSWDSVPGIASLYVNGQFAASEKRFPHAGHETSVQDTNHPAHYIGINESSHNGDYQKYVGKVKRLTVAKGFVRSIRDLMALGYTVTGDYPVLAEYLEGKNAAGDANTELVGDSKWVSGDSAVVLNGRGSVRVPAVHFQTEDFSFGIWINPDGFRNQTMYLYSDWTSPWSFLFALQPHSAEGQFSVVAELRRDINSGGSDPNERSLLRVGGGRVKPHEWTYLSLSWAGVPGIATISVNGTFAESALRNSYAGSESIVQQTKHSTHDVGMKGDTSNSFFVGEVKSLTIVKGAVTLW